MNEDHERWGDMLGRNCYDRVRLERERLKELGFSRERGGRGGKESGNGDSI